MLRPATSTVSRKEWRAPYHPAIRSKNGKKKKPGTRLTTRPEYNQHLTTQLIILKQKDIHSVGQPTTNTLAHKLFPCWLPLFPRHESEERERDTEAAPANPIHSARPKRTTTLPHQQQQRGGGGGGEERKRRRRNAETERVVQSSKAPPLRTLLFILMCLGRAVVLCLHTHSHPITQPPTFTKSICVARLPLLHPPHHHPHPTPQLDHLPTLSHPITISLRFQPKKKTHRLFSFLR